MRPANYFYAVLAVLCACIGTYWLFCLGHDLPFADLFRAMFHSKGSRGIGSYEQGPAYIFITYCFGYHFLLKTFERGIKKPGDDE